MEVKRTHALAPGARKSFPTGRISEKSESVAKYSVLSEGKQIFAAKYLQFLPTEEELARELERERRLLEERSEGA